MTKPNQFWEGCKVVGISMLFLLLVMSAFGGCVYCCQGFLVDTGRQILKK